jgi:hypothetical protein
MSPLALAELPEDWDEIVENIVTEDNEPVDSLITERQMRLLTRTLYSSWQPPPDEDQPQQPRKFFAAANVGVFSSVNTPPIVPDVFLSLDVEPKADWTKNKNRAYFIWEFDKPPDVALEIVSTKSGGELSAKLKRYAQLAVKYYVVLTPCCNSAKTPCASMNCQWSSPATGATACATTTPCRALAWA